MAEKLEVHHTLQHGSWFNMAEPEPSVLQRQCLRQRLPDREAVDLAVASRAALGNAALATIRRQSTTADARTKLRRLYPAFDD